jgi:diadenosine tetraphosphate (Ap4A) HIT family hydrolase
MAKDFSKNLIKDYKYWSVYAHENQGYLGRCVVWCKRKNTVDLADATQVEQRELFLILKDLQQACRRCFNPDWLNYAFLGNKSRHLHGHFVPRYAGPKNFEGVVFEDKLYGHNYRTDHSFVTPEEVLQKIKQIYIEALK